MVKTLKKTNKKILKLITVLIVLGSCLGLVIFVSNSRFASLELVSAGSFDTCDSLSNSYGAWDSGTIFSIDTSNKLEGAGSLKGQLMQDNYAIWLWKRPLISWDFSQTSLLTFNVMVSDYLVAGDFYVSIITNEAPSYWVEYTWRNIEIRAINTWQEVTINLSNTPTGGLPNLTQVKQITFALMKNSGYSIMVAGTTLNIDYVTVASSGLSSTPVPTITSTPAPTTTTSPTPVPTSSSMPSTSPNTSPTPTANPNSTATPAPTLAPTLTVVNTILPKIDDNVIRVIILIVIVCAIAIIMHLRKRHR
jgi:hypothetical protein